MAKTDLVCVVFSVKFLCWSLFLSAEWGPRSSQEWHYSFTYPYNAHDNIVHTYTESELSIVFWKWKVERERKKIYGWFWNVAWD